MGRLLYIYWKNNNQLINNLNSSSLHHKFKTFGILSAIFLVIHSILLGVKFDIQIYKLMRRVVLLLFIIFEIIAQGILVYHFFKIKDKLSKLINKKVLGNLGKDGVLINVARGSVIDQDELIYSLENNLILAAGLDVYTNEPNIPEKLINLDNTVLLPHIASGTVETRNAMGQLVFDNIENYFQKKSLISEVV